MATVIVWALGSFFTRLIAALGISFTTYAALSKAVEKLIQYIQPNLNQLPQDALNILTLAGIDEALSIMVSALATRAAFVSARVFISASKK